MSAGYADVADFEEDRHVSLLHAEDEIFDHLMLTVGRRRDRFAAAVKSCRCGVASKGFQPNSIP